MIEAESMGMAAISSEASDDRVPEDNARVCGGVEDGDRGVGQMQGGVRIEEEGAGGIVGEGAEDDETAMDSEERARGGARAKEMLIVRDS